MNEYLMLGLVGVIALVAGLGASWISRAMGGKNNKDKTS